MTGYEKELLALAYKATQKISNGALSVGASGWVELDHGDLSVYATGDLAENLTALLRDLGVEVQERPSAEGIGRAHVSLGKFGALPRWRDLYAREPLTVLALLEGGEA